MNLKQSVTQNANTASNSGNVKRNGLYLLMYKVIFQSLALLLPRNCFQVCFAYKCNSSSLMLRLTGAKEKQL